VGAGGLAYTNDMLPISQHNGVTVVELEASYESLDAEALEELGKLLLDEAASVEPPLILLDLAHTRFIGSSFIELLVRVWKRLKSRDGTMALCNMKPFCAEVIRVTRLDTLWDVFPSRDRGIASMAGEM
jgi:anti-sigma B factor antagonist